MADDPYDVYVPGKLKLKRVAVDKTIKKKSKKKVAKEPLRVSKEEGDEVPSGASEDNRTEAEKRMDAAVEAREKESIRLLASKSYRERVEDFNTHLEALTEHYDIPKVGPG